MKLHLGERWRKKVKSFNTRLFFTRILFNNIFPIIFQIEISYTIHYTVFYAIQHLQIIHQNPPFTRILEYCKWLHFSFAHHFVQYFVSYLAQPHMAVVMRATKYNTGNKEENRTQNVLKHLEVHFSQSLRLLPIKWRLKSMSTKNSE